MKEDTVSLNWGYKRSACVLQENDRDTRHKRSGPGEEIRTRSRRLKMQP
jgi:hypothetical protein